MPNSSGDSPASPSPIQIGLSTASVYPQNTEAAFKYAAELGFDGVELMVWAETVSQDAGAIADLSKKYSVPVLAVHAPCLLISQRVWGTNPIAKLDRSAQVAEQLGANVVVVHPPFRWQRRYASGFAEQIERIEAETDIKIAVENMFPMRADSFVGRRGKNKDKHQDQDKPTRGTLAGVTFSAFAPTYDPTDTGYSHYTLDLSHTSTSRDNAIELANRMGSGLSHLHLTDGKGAAFDEHLLPGHGTQPVVEICQMLANGDFTGHAVLEINTQSARSAVERSSLLHQALTFARVHLNRN